MTSTMTDIDPFAGGDSVPALSFKNAPVGTVQGGTVLEPAQLVQGRDYDTGDPAFWPAKPGETPNPVMCAVIRIALDSGEERAIWATKPSALFTAIQKAQKDAGARIAIGGRVEVKFTGEEPSKSGKGMKKLYAVRYTPPAPTDPFGDATPAQQAPAAQAAPVNTATVFNGTQGGGAQPPF